MNLSVLKKSGKEKLDNILAGAKDSICKVLRVCNLLTSKRLDMLFYGVDPLVTAAMIFHHYFVDALCLKNLLVCS